MSIILAGKQELGVHDVAYRGLILEYGEHAVERYAQPGTVLADPELASNVAGAQRGLAALGREQTLTGFQVSLVTFLLGLTEQCASATLAPPTPHMGVRATREGC